MTEKWEIEASGLEAFLDGKDPEEIKEVPWPTKPSKVVGLKILPDAVLRECDKRTREWATATGISYDPLNLFKNSEYLYSYAAEIVSEALVDPTTGKKLCISSKQLTTSYRRETIQALFAAYGEHCKATLPEDPNVLSQEQFDGLVEQLKKNPSMTLLEELSLSSLKNLVLFMASQQTKSTG